jgi:hypothetical protein
MLLTLLSRRPTITRDLRVVLATCLSLAALGVRPARAADPTTAECLSANEASLNARSKHRLRDARVSLLKCAAPSCPTDVRDECTRGVNEINAALPTIVFEAKDTAGADLVAVKVTMDGELLADHLDGTALAVDPGEHTLSFETPGQPKVEKQLLIREGEKDRHERIVLGTAVVKPPVGPGPGESTAPGTTLVSSPRGATGAPSSGLGGQRTGALVAGGVGVVSVALGIGFGLESRSKHNQAMSACPTRSCATPAQADLWNDATTYGTVTNVAFVVGATGLAGGAALWFGGKPASSEPTAQVGLGLGTLQLRGIW